MHQLKAISQNFPLITAISAWLSAQIIKFVLTFIFCREDLTPAKLLSSGGMPSSHSATVCALTASIALIYGISSPLFAISAVLSFIVMYDAAGVRRSAGEQARKINNIITHLSDSHDEFEHDDPVKEILGHTPLQVAVGAVLGISVALFAGFLF